MPCHIKSATKPGQRAYNFIPTSLYISSPQQLPAFTISGTSFHFFSVLPADSLTQIWGHYIEADPWFDNINDPSNYVMSLGHTFRSPHGTITYVGALCSALFVCRMSRWKGHRAWKATVKKMPIKIWRMLEKDVRALKVLEKLAGVKKRLGS